jgi:hypothetical protein
MPKLPKVEVFCRFYIGNSILTLIQFSRFLVSKLPIFPVDKKTERSDTTILGILEHFRHFRHFQVHSGWGEGEKK